MTSTEKLKFNMPDHAEQKVATILEDKKRILFVEILFDQDSPNPLEDMDGYGHIYSLGRRHVNFDQEKVEDAVKNDKDAVPLSYYEHSQCVWFVQGQDIPGVEFQWDGVQFAGVWVPDKSTRESTKLRGKKRQAWMREQAKSACEVYTDWCNGRVYGYVVKLYELKRDEDGEIIEAEDYYDGQKPLQDDSCFGIYGWNYLEEVVREAIDLE